MTSYKIPSKAKLVQVALFWSGGGTGSGHPSPSDVCGFGDSWLWDCWGSAELSSPSVWDDTAAIAASIALSDANLSSAWKGKRR